ncbi:hypothetical protein BBJ28_00015022 [Nothophytophthora sp. Chile5]|nr:hypothetical protein BBJ28_00015022 [Nothophytophthora sp. Chile5]
MRSNDSQKIIAVGIPKNLDDGGLSELFSEFGTVAEAKVVLDANTKESRGFGFVTYTAASSMRAAIKGMNQKKIDGRTLNVRQLVPKDQFQSQKSEEQDVSKRPCWLLRKGKCTKGANCPFSHETKDGEFGSCFEFAQTGYCKRGDMCKFHHPPPQPSEDGEEFGSAAGSVASKDAKPPMKRATEADKSTPAKPRVCYGFQNGRCHRGKNCMFVHELLPGEAPIAAGSKDKKTKKTEEKKPVKEPFEVVTSQTEAGKKRRRSDDEDEEEEEAEEDVPPAKSERASVSHGDSKQKAPAAAGLAAHVNSYMSSRPSKPQPMKSKPTPAPRKFEWKAKLATDNRPQHQNQERPAKKVKTEKVDMGSAFDGLSDDESKASKSRVVDKETIRANREKLKLERRAKRSAKKTALTRLQGKGEVELET